MDIFGQEWVLDYTSYSMILLKRFLIFGSVTKIWRTHYSAVSNLIFIKDKHEKNTENFEGIGKDLWQIVALVVQLFSVITLNLLFWPKFVLNDAEL